MLEAFDNIPGLREKRISKPPVPYVIPKVCYPRKRKKKLKQRPLDICEFQIIPFPIKFIYTSAIYPIYGDIHLREQDGTLVTDTQFINNGVNCRGVNIIERNGFKTICISLEKKSEFKLPPWQDIVEKLKRSNNFHLEQWGDIIKEYCINHENLLRSLSDGKMIPQQQDMVQYLNNTSEAANKIDKLFRKYPSINFRSKIIEGSVRLTEICPNEKYLQELGYSIDSFTTTVLREGLPRLIPVHSSQTTQNLIQNYEGIINKHGCISPEYESILVLKSGYKRKIRFRVYYLPTFENNVPGFDCFVVLTGKDPLLYPTADNESHCYVNQEFLQEVQSKEYESKAFIDKFYHSPVKDAYANMNKVCRIRELDIETA